MTDLTNSGPPSSDYKLVWSDEFDGNEIDQDKWIYRGLGPRGDAVLTKECAKLDGQSNLVLTTRRTHDIIETGMVATEGKFETTFGYFEARMKFQTQTGHWSAFWLQSSTMAKIGDPKTNGTEIDIIELFGSDRKTMFMNLHWDGYGIEHKKVGSKHADSSLSDGWHVIGLEWTAEEYKFFLDGKEVWRTDQAVSHAKEYIIFSLEVREWAGNISEAKLPDSLYVDYVRVYSK
jgi:beta-glucanase (GH16 family)